MPRERAEAVLASKAEPIPGSDVVYGGDIVGGSDARPGRWPGVVSINVVAEFDLGDDRAGHFCGGSVIAPTWVLTAAHCLSEPSQDGVGQEVIPAQLLEVVAGRTSLSTTAGKRHAVAQVFISEGWAHGRTGEDIGLLQLASPSRVPVTGLLGPDNESAAPPSPGARVPHGTVWATGWGSTVADSDKLTTPNPLQELAVSLWTQSDCAAVDLLFDSATSACAGPREGDHPADACYGDSGGPLMRLDRRTGAFRQLGIVSRAAAVTASPDCAVPGHPTIYTRVAPFSAAIASLAGVTFRADPPPLPKARVLGGATRFSTSVAVSQAAYPDGAETVTVATGASFGDALAGAPAAAAGDGPLLLVPSEELPNETRAEIERLGPERIRVLGGTQAVARRVAAELAELTADPIERIAGATRYETAAAVSRAAFHSDVEKVFLATGTSFADALTGGAAAARNGAPLLLVPGDQAGVPNAVLDEIERLRPQNVILLGGPAAISTAMESSLRRDLAASVERIGGGDRYATALAVARRAVGGNEALYITTGEQFPDALSAGTLAATTPGPLLLVPKAELPMNVRAAIEDREPPSVTVIGGPAAVTDMVLHQFGPSPHAG